MSAPGVRHPKEITFYDDGIRWTVVPLPAGRVLGAGPVGFKFVSDGGECRVTNGHVPDGVSWQAVDEVAWRELLRHALLVT